MELFYRKNGVGDPLIILHGLFGSGMNWNTLSKFFGEEYEVFLVDQRNHGRSPHDDGMSYPLMADDLFDFINRHKLHTPSIIGHSMGAKTAITFASNHPEMVNKLVAVDMGIREYAVQDEDLQEGLLSLDFDAIASRSEADDALRSFIPDIGTRGFIMQNLQWGPDKKMQWRMNVKSIIANINEIGNAVEIEQPYLGATLFVKGADSDYIRTEDSAHLLEKFPNGSIVEISNAGHWIHADNPKEFGEVVMRFLKS